MKAFDYAGLELDELQTKLKSLQDEAFRTRIEHATAQLQDSSKLRVLRKEIARAKTAIRAKQLAQ